MSLLVFQHQASEPPAVIGSVLRDHGHALRVVELHAGQPVPVDLDGVDGILSMGGAPNVDETEKHPWLAAEMAYLKAAHGRGVPIVGICLGAQLIAAALGGKVAAMATPEVGWGNVKMAFPGTIDTIYTGIPWETMQVHLHGQEVTALPPGATPLAGSKACKTQAFKVGSTTYGFQYHFEWSETDIRAAAKDDLTARAGVNPETVIQGIAQHYDQYRRLGDRLCETIALMLFPIDKRRD
jgi:GMP synthase-like glutamine amidotransferase